MICATLTNTHGEFFMPRQEKIKFTITQDGMVKEDTEAAKSLRAKKVAKIMSYKK